ncbi:MAG: glycosyltransferase family 39 protein, partial [Chloroflexota bacterium]|jgi:4-amino-4-deoxy-L-arabinose transferase-like glycosyltransferase
MAIPVLLFAIALAVRVVIAGLFADPAYPDALYYANVGRELAAGGGFSVAYIWNFVEVGGTLPEAGRLPIPSNAHWMPLAVVVQVPFIWALGPTTVASALPFWLAAAATAPLTYVIARDAGMLAWQGAAAGLLVAVPAGVTPFLGQPDNFALYMLLGALALWLCARGLRGHRGSFAAGGVVVGLAFLSRNDGVLLGVPFALAFCYDLLRAPRLSRIGWWPAFACAAGFVLVAAPWLLRQLDVFGSVSPSSIGGRILFITEYRELYSVTGETTLEAFLGQGLGSLIESRLGGLWDALLIFAASPMLVLLVPPLLIGIWARRRSRDFIPWYVYAGSLFVFTALVSAVHVPFGTFIHSAVALIPHAYLLAMVGVTAVVAWVAARRPGWDAPRASRNIAFMVVGVIMVVSAFATLSTIDAWRRERDGRADVLATLSSVADPTDVIMSPDAGAYRYHGDWAGIVTPDDPLPVVERAARLYGARWLALESDHITSALRPVLAGETRPAWLSEPLVLSPAWPDADEDEAEAEPLPRAALYAVCLEPSDERCDA